MTQLADSLADYVEYHFASVIKQSDTNPVRPILVGPQLQTLKEVFNYLTNNGQTPWTIVVSGTSYKVAVLLVDGRSQTNATPQAALATACQWDYAVTIRNSCPYVLILVDPSVWDKRPESLTNTTETLGSPRTQQSTIDSSLWKHIISSISASRGVQERFVREIVEQLFTQAANLEVANRDAHVWDFTNYLLDPAQPGLSPEDALCYSSGLPAAAGSTIQASIKVLHRLASFLSEKGFTEGFQGLKQTAPAQTQQLDQPLDDLHSWITGRAPSAMAFAIAPSRLFKPTAPVPHWFQLLTTPVLSSMLDELRQDQSQGKLNLFCENALISSVQGAGLPCVVMSSPVLKAVAPLGVAVGNADFSRRVGRNLPEAFQPDPSTPTSWTDDDPPSHDKAINYAVNAPNFLAGTIDILVLDTFAAQGLAHTRDAMVCSIPASRSGSPWTQELTLPRGGATDLVIFHSSQTATVQLTLVDGISLSQQVAFGSSSTSFAVELEDGDEVQVQLISAGGVGLSSWTVVIVVEDPIEIARSRFEALLHEHRTGKKHNPQPTDSLAQRLESNSYLPESNSWKPVFACWSGKIEGSQIVNWSDPRLGNVPPQIDPRPPVVITPPPAFLSAREAVRKFLLATRLPIAEAQLDALDLQPLLQEYLNEYTHWLDSAPEVASWSDVIAIHSTDFNQQAAAYVPSEEPIVVLLSPLHPFRLVWLATAQKQLHDSTANRCPAAGLLDPSSCPDVGVLYLWNGQQTPPRSFFSLPCENPHWAVLLNTAYLDRTDEKDSVIRCLNALGLSVQGITGGFTSGQAEDSLRDVNRLL
ncbi:MAG: hypothetical protein WCL11_23585, partial [Verrucomicrobiota bacterium]